MKIISKQENPEGKRCAATSSLEAQTTKKVLAHHIHRKLAVRNGPVDKVVNILKLGQFFFSKLIHDVNNLLVTRQEIERPLNEGGHVRVQLYFSTVRDLPISIDGRFG